MTVRSKADVERSYHQGNRGEPMINVKNHLWVPDLIRRFRDTGHEFSGDAAFWAWVDEQWDQAVGYPSPFDQADEIAREACWVLAAEYAHEIWPAWSTEMVDEKKFFPEYPPGCRWRFTGKKVARRKHHVRVRSAGRSGGWLVVDGLPDVDDWDLQDLNRWRRFESLIRELADNWYPYQFIWHLHVNVWEPDVRDPQREADQWIDALATLT